MLNEQNKKSSEKLNLSEIKFFFECWGKNRTSTGDLVAFSLPHQRGTLVVNFKLF